MHKHVTTEHAGGFAAHGNDFPRDGFAREPEVLRFVGFGRSTLWAKAKDGSFPKPLKLSERVTVWPRNLVWDWYEAQTQKQPKAA